MIVNRLPARFFQFHAPRRGVSLLHFRPRLEPLEDRTVPAVVTVDATSALRAVNDQVLGVNLAWWDSNLSTSTTLQLVQDAGLHLFRQPGGSSADTFHFNAGPSFSGAATVATFNALTENAGGDGLVTVNYGTGSPQEATAYLAYCNAAVNDPTVLGTGLQWSDTSHSWVSKDWKTAGYWAGLRAATPITPDDGLNYLRVGHPAPYGWHYFEVGNEEYGSWETDHHTPAHDPATYVQFAKDFTALARQIDPSIAVGLGVQGTQGNFGSQGGNWAHEILNQCALKGYIPDFLSDHDYMFNPGQENDATLLLHTINDPNFTTYEGPKNWVGRSQAYRALLQQYLGGAAAGVELLCTELNSVSSSPSNQTTSLVNGLWLADALGGILQTEYNGCIVWDLRNSYDTSHYYSNLYGWRRGGDYGLLGSDSNTPPPATGRYVPYPTYFAEQLFAHVAHNGDTVVQAASDDPNLSVYAVQQQNGDLALLVINKNPTTNLIGQFTLTGFAANAQAVVWQYGAAQDNAQSQTTDGSSSLANFHQTLRMTGSSSFRDLFPAYSMTVLDLSPAGALPLGVPPAAVGQLCQADAGTMNPDREPQRQGDAIPNTPIDVCQGLTGRVASTPWATERPVPMEARAWSAGPEWARGFLDNVNAPGEAGDPFPAGS
jgi:hypothetical protein